MVQYIIIDSMDIFQTLTTNPNPTIAILASIVMILSGIIVYQWQYTMKHTVPKWIWDEFINKVDKLIESTTVIKERVGRNNK